VPAAALLPICDTAGTLPRQQSPTQKMFRFPRGEQAFVVNMDGYGDAGVNCVSLGTVVY